MDLIPLMVLASNRATVFIVPAPGNWVQPVRSLVRSFARHNSSLGRVTLVLNPALFCCCCSRRRRRSAKTSRAKGCPVRFSSRNSSWYSVGVATVSSRSTTRVVNAPRSRVAINSTVTPTGLCSCPSRNSGGWTTSLQFASEFDLLRLTIPIDPATGNNTRSSQSETMCLTGFQSVSGPWYWRCNNPPLLLLASQRLRASLWSSLRSAQA
mmetsp:Transcript_24583/g.67851  ORF Transcript_24583/g.67851 Transcript_24583/m.67851 type:complete len:210 (-) Transcript_24583:1264-1893(-)